MEPTPNTPLLSTRADAAVPVLAAVLVVAMLSGLADVGITALASTEVDIQYRFHVVGLFFGAFQQVTTLLVLVAAIAIVTGRRSMLRGASIAIMAMAVVVLILLPIFGLDLLQVRRAVPQQNVKGFTLAALKTAGFSGLYALLGLWAGWRGIQASAKTRGAERRTEGQGLVVGQE